MMGWFCMWEENDFKVVEKREMGKRFSLGILYFGFNWLTSPKALEMEVGRRTSNSLPISRMSPKWNNLKSFPEGGSWHSYRAFQKLLDNMLWGQDETWTVLPHGWHK